MHHANIFTFILGMVEKINMTKIEKIKFKYMGYMEFHSSTLMLFDNQKLILDIHQKKLNKNYNDYLWLKNNEATIGSTIGHSFIYYNEIGEKGANEIRILSTKSMEDEFIKGGKWNTKRINAIEKFLKQKNNIFKVEKIETQTLSIVKGEIGFILPSELFSLYDENKSIRALYKKKKKIDANNVINTYGYYYDMDNNNEVIGGFIKCENGEYDIYSCKVNNEEYGYIIKLNNQKITNENMTFMF